MAWGIFDHQGGMTHVAPVEGGDYLKRPHELTLGCPCQPAVLEYEGVPMVVHEEIQ